MMTLRRRLHRLLALARGNRLDHELDEEIVSHLELAEREALEAGLPPEEARRLARLRFGNVEPMREAHRDQRSARWIEDLLKDLRYGFSSLLRDRAFAAITIGVLALGIGANTAMFSLVDAVLLKPLPFPQPERMVRLWEAPDPADPTDRNAIAALNFLDWKRRSTSFEALSAEGSAVRVALLIGGEPVRVAGQPVSADYFRVFGVEALHGRTFAAGEDQPGAAPVMVLSHAAWQSRFGGDPRIVNSTLVLDGQAHTVIGILPPGSFDRESTEFWRPLVFSDEEQRLMTRDYHSLLAVARLKPGVTLAQARQEMRRIGAETARLSPPGKRDWRVRVEPFDELLVEDGLRQSLYLVFGAVVLVLLIACANVSNLLLARGLARSKEMAVRAALGAERGRLVRQLLTEVVVLAALGGLAGLGVAYGLVRLAAVRFAPLLPPTASIDLDLRTLGFAMAAAFTVVVVVGVLPALRTSMTSFTAALGQGGRGNSSGSRERVRRLIVSAEVALSLVLVCGAALLFKSLVALQSVSTGTRVENIIAASADLPLPAYPTPGHATRVFDTLVQRLQAVPGVTQAALSTNAPLQGVRQGTQLTVPGFDDDIGVGYKRISAGYFAALDIPVIAGRALNDGDRSGTPPVLVINEATARRLRRDYGVLNPLGQVLRGKKFLYERDGFEMVDWTVVGVIRDERVDDLRDAVRPVVYVSLAQVPRREVRLVLRTAGDPALVMNGVREAVRGVDPNLPLGGVQTMAQIASQSLSGAREPAQVVGAFAIVAGVLTALGLYGVLSQIVAQRRREIGIRVALGARPREILTLVVGAVARIAGAGLVFGVLGVFALSQVLQGVLFNVSPLDPGMLILACVAMTTLALLAAAVPARRASAVDPVTVLREEG